MMKTMKNPTILAVILAVVVANVLFPINTALAQTNNAPVWTPEDNKEAYTNVALNFDVEAHDPESDKITYTVVDAPEHAQFQPATRTFKWIPREYQTGNHVITFQAYDGRNYSQLFVYVRVNFNQNVETLSGGPNTGLPVNPIVNRAPIFVNFAPTIKACVSTMYSYDLQAFDADNDPVSFTLLTGPEGMTLNSVSGLILWIPQSNQLNFNKVQVIGSDGKSDTTVTFFIFVQPTCDSAPVPAPTPAPAPAPAPVVEPLVISNMEITVNDAGEIIVKWETNKAASARVIYGTESFEDGNPKSYTYPNATPDTDFLAKKHEVNIGKLEMEVIYFLRAVSKTETQIAVSREITFVQLPDGSVAAFNVASLFAILGALLVHPAFLLLALLILAVLFALQYRKNRKVNSPL